MTLKRKWFELIATGRKKEEYREYKPHWINRVYEKTFYKSGVVKLEPKSFDLVEFSNGYGSVPVAIVKFAGVMVLATSEIKPRHGEIIKKPQFVIFLGDVMELNQKARELVYSSKYLPNCPMCGSKVDTDGVNVWCTFVGSAIEKGCDFGTFRSVDYYRFVNKY